MTVPPDDLDAFVEWAANASTAQLTAWLHPEVGMNRLTIGWSNGAIKARMYTYAPFSPPQEITDYNGATKTATVRPKA